MLESSLSSEPRTTNMIVGHFDYVDEDFAYGWACDPAKSFEPVRVDILCGGRIVGQGLASEHRQDLKDAGIGEGNHAFKIKLSYELSDGQTHSLLARNSSTGAILAGSEVTYGPAHGNLDFSIISRETGSNYLNEVIVNSKPNNPQDNATRITQAFQIGCLLQETGKIDDARYVWESLAKVLGENALLATKIAEGYLLNDNPEQALKFYKKAAEQNLLFTWAHLGMSACYRQLNDYDSAREAFDFACHTVVHHEAALEHIALEESYILPILVEDLIAAENTEKAIEILYKKLIEDADHKYAQEKIALILAGSLSYLGSDETREILVSHSISLELLKMALTHQNQKPF
ncbi:tetratricopeptide repeat protein [Pseudomonas entomophila]|uniref:tetratricopeptide repeat protein n=1 Tax=Pseudomonas entomophila TaxID=312306 RepID=UPI003EBC35E7